MGTVSPLHKVQPDLFADVDLNLLEVADLNELSTVGWKTLAWEMAGMLNEIQTENEQLKQRLARLQPQRIEDT